MKRQAKPATRPRARTTRRGPAPAAIDARRGASADEPERPGIEQAEQVDTEPGARTAATDIERADERKLGSVQGLPPEAPDSRITGFEEPDCDDGAEGPLPPHLEED